MLSKYVASSFFFFTFLPTFGQLEGPFGHGDGLFPSSNGFYSGISNPALRYEEQDPRTAIRVHDRFLLPELALQEWRLIVPNASGNWQFHALHYGYSAFRKLRISLGHSLRLSKRTQAGLRVGPVLARIGEGHGQRFSWNGSLGIRSSFSEHWRWSFWIRDPHAALWKQDETELLNPAAGIAFGRKWRDAGSWSVRIRKGFDRPLSLRSRGRIRLHERFYLITGLYGPPLSPILGWNYAKERSLILLVCGWTPVLGITPECGLYYRFGE